MSSWLKDTLRNMHMNLRWIHLSRFLLQYVNNISFLPCLPFTFSGVSAGILYKKVDFMVISDNVRLSFQRVYKFNMHDKSS